MKVPEDPKEIQRRQHEALVKRLNQQFNKSNVSGKLDNDLSFLEQEKIRAFLTCLKAAAQGHPSLGADCRDDWRALTRGDLDSFRRQGILLPEDFEKSLAQELMSIKSEVASYKKEDQVIVVEDFIVLNEVAPEDLESMKVVDPNIKELSLNITEVLVKLSRSDQVLNMSQDKLTEELFVLGEVINRIKEDCPDDDKFNRDPGFLMKDLKLSKFKTSEETSEERDVANYLLGVNSEQKLETIDGYKFYDGKNTYYLYKGRKKQNDQTWIMGKLTPDGKLDFRYYRISEEQPLKTEIAQKDDIKLIRSFTQKTRSEFQKNRKFYFQAQEGLTIKADEVEAPLIGRAIIPQAKLVIGRVNMAYLSDKNISQSNITVEHDRVSLGADTKPFSGNWALGSRLQVSPIKGDWNVSSNVRVHNLLLGYGFNSKGDNNANVSYVLSRNFVTVQTGKDDRTRMTLGRQFKNGKGFVSGSTDFNKIHQLKLILFLQ